MTGPLHPTKRAAAMLPNCFAICQRHCLRFAGIILALLLGSTTLFAQEFIELAPLTQIDDRALTEPVVIGGPQVQTTFGLRTWLSTGRSTISYAGVAGVPDVMSELHWRR